jgi:hypothetical protein
MRSGASSDVAGLAWRLAERVAYFRYSDRLW